MTPGRVRSVPGFAPRMAAVLGAVLALFLFAAPPEARALLTPDETEINLEIPQGAISLQGSQGGRLRVAVVDFHAPSLPNALRTGWLILLEHELTFRTGYEGLFDAVTREEVAEARKGVPPVVAMLSPREIPAIRTALNADVLVFLDLTRPEHAWLLRARLFSGRTGAFLASFTTPFLEGEPRESADRLLAELRARLVPAPAKTGEPEPLIPAPAPEAELLLPAAIAGLDALKTACTTGHCLTQLPFLEWVKLHNPDFALELFKNPQYLNAAFKEADDALNLARLNLLSDNPHEATLALKKELEKATHPKGVSEAELRRVLARAYLALNQPQDAREAWTLVASRDPGNAEARAALALLDCGARKFEEARPALAALESPNTPAQALPPATWRALLDCRASQKSDDPAALAPLRRQLVLSLKQDGARTRANAALLEWLDASFQREVLLAIDFSLLSDMERRNLASILSQRSILHDGDEGLILVRLAELKWMEGRADEAQSLLEAVRKIGVAAKDPKFLPDANAAFELGAAASLYQRKDAATAAKYLDAIPPERRDLLLAARVALAANQDDAALALLTKAEWPAAYALLHLETLAAFYAKKQDWPALRQTITRAEALYRGADWLVTYGAEASVTPEEAPRLAMRTDLLLMRGLPFPAPDSAARLYAKDYEAVLQALPLAGLSEKGVASTLGRVAVLLADPIAPNDWQERARPFRPREEERIAKEWRAVLASRYQVVEAGANELSFRRRLAPGEPYRPTKTDLLTLASSLGADSLILLSTAVRPDLGAETVETTVQILLYDGANQHLYTTGTSRTLGFFELYRFNTLWLILPGVLLLLVLLAAWRLKRATSAWSDPLKRAERLAKQRHYRRAAQLLERHGFLLDSLDMLGHHHVREQNYAQALDFFLRAHDLENAVIALKGCPDTESVHALAADLFMQLKDYDRAEFYYRKLRNLPGLAKIAEARQDPDRAARILGQHFFEIGNFPAALNEYLKAEDYNRAGMVCFYTDDYRQAALHFRKAGNEKMYMKCLMRLGVKNVEPTA